MTGTSGSASRRKRVEYGKYGYLFIAPFFITYLVFQFGPLLYTVALSFFEYYKKGLKTVGPNFVGLKNYFSAFRGTDGALFGSMTFKTLGNTIFMWMMNFVPQILMSLLLAAWFTDTKVKLRGQGAYKVMIFLPNIITAASISVLFYSLFNSNGAITHILQNMGVIAKDYDFMLHALPTQLLIAFIQFWMWYGNTMIILIAGILGINPSLFEAAMVDGATSFQIFRKITLPLLKPIVLFTLVTSAIGGLQMYDIPALFNVNQGGDGMPDYASTTITMYIRKLTLTASDFGKASATSMILFIVTLIISLLFFHFLGDKEQKQKR